MTTSKLVRASAAGLVAGPLMLTIGDVLRRVVDHSAGASSTRLTAAVADRPGIWLAAALLSALAPIAFLPGVAALVATARGRGATATTVGGAMIGIGLIMSVAHAVEYYSSYAVFGRAGSSGATVKALDDAAASYPMSIVLIVLFIVGMVFGTIVLLVGLRLAGRVPVWSVVAGVVFAAAANSGSVAFGLVELAAALVAFVPAARALTTADPVSVDVR